MSNRYMQQFFYSLIKMATGFQGQVNLIPGAIANITEQDLQFKAKAYGASGNSITVEYVGGGTGGAEVVTVTGNAIQVQIEDNVSTADQIKTALDASVAAAALITTTVSGTGSNAQVIFGPTALAGGIDGVSSCTILGVSAAQTAVGEITLTLAETFPQLMDVNVTMEKAIAQDLIPQVKSNDVVSAKTIVINLLTTATKTDPLAACALHVSMFIRASSVPF